MDIYNLTNLIIKTSGPWLTENNTAKLSMDKNKIYSSFHFKQLNLVNSQRNTIKRFNKFKIPKDLSNLTVQEFGCNLGALSFECLRRNCLSVTSFDINDERIHTCIEIAKYLNYDNKSKFQVIDLRNYILS